MYRESTLIVRVPTAEPIIGRVRRWLDSGRNGMPAHITILFPFLQPDELDEMATESLKQLFAGQERFSFKMMDIGWFDERIMFLTTEPAEPFKALTAAVLERFPDHLPYRGLFNEVRPHVTVASRGRAALLRRVARRVGRQLPIAGEATEVVMMVNEWDGTWRMATTFPLGVTRVNRADSEN